MKKAVLIMLIAITFSCSSSDSGTGTNKIVGNWKKVASTIQTGVNGTPTNNLGNCDTNSTFAFAQFSGGLSGTVTWVAYNYDSALNTCVIQGQGSDNWSDLGSNTYDFSNSGPSNVIFTNNNRTMNSTFNDGPYVLKSTFSKQP